MYIYITIVAVGCIYSYKSEKEYNLMKQQLMIPLLKYTDELHFPRDSATLRPLSYNSGGKKEVYYCIWTMLLKSKKTC